MPCSYTMCFLDRLDIAILRREVLAGDDSEAVRHGLTLCKTHRIEIFQGGRLVARIPKADNGRRPAGAPGRDDKTLETMTG